MECALVFFRKLKEIQERFEALSKEGELTEGVSKYGDFELIDGYLWSMQELLFEVHVYIGRSEKEFKTYLKAVVSFIHTNFSKPFPRYIDATLDFFIGDLADMINDEDHSAASNSDIAPTVRELLAIAHKDNGRLTNEQLRELAEKHGKSVKYVQNKYNSIKYDLK